MALVPVARVYSFTADGNFQTTATWSGLDFDTDTHTIVPSSGSYRMALLDPRPTNFSSAADTYLWFECATDFTQTKWFYVGGTTVRTETIANSMECGWTPPVVQGPTCDLVLTASATGDVITAAVSGAHGAVTYSVDGGATRQSSPVFRDLPPRSYVVTAYDAGAASCSRSVTVAVVATSASLTPVAGALPAVAFCYNPIALTGRATQSGRSLLMELFVETAHGSNHYQRVVQRLRPTGPAGTTVLELQKQLAAVLVPDRPSLSRAAGLRRLTTNIRRYYAALAEIQGGTGLPGPFVFEAPRTVLLGGLSWPAAKAAPFFDPMPARWLTWRPNTVQEVGPGHVLLHSALLPVGITACTAVVQCFALGAAQPFQTLTYPLGNFLGGIGVLNGGRGTDERRLDPPTPWLVEFLMATADLPAGTCRVSVQLFSPADVALTDVRTFRFDTRKRRRQFIFLNSLGQWDTVSCSGPRASKTTVDRTVATRLAAPDYDPQSGPSSVHAITADDRISVSTGAVAPEELHWLRELHTSREVYEVAGAQLRKILLTTKDFTNYQDDAGADGYTFEYQYSFDPLPYERYDWLPTA